MEILVIKPSPPYLFSTSSSPNSLLKLTPFLHPPTKIPPRKYYHHQRAQCSQSASFLDMKAILTPKPLEIDVPWFNPATQPPRFDVIIIGAGPAGLRLAEQVSKNGIKVCVIDPFPLSRWTKTYGVWIDEFEGSGLDDCFEKIWLKTSVYVDEHRTMHLNRAYGKIDRKKLKLKFLSNCVANNVKFQKAKAVKVEHEEFESYIVCDDGTKLKASLVVDAGGYSTSFVEFDRPRTQGYQVVCGILAEVDHHPFDLDKMVLMDMRDSHLENNPNLHSSNVRLPSFFYGMPMDSNLLLLEEAILVVRPLTSIMELKKRLEARVRHLGIRVRTIIEYEDGAVPMGGPLPRIPQRVMGFGGNSGLVHPSSATMVAQAMAMAPVVAEAITECLGSGRLIRGMPLCRRAWDGLWPLERRCMREFYCLGMEILLKLDLNGQRRFLEAFFEIDSYYWHGFLSARLSTGELAAFGLNVVRHSSNLSRLELLKKCPGPLVNSLGNLVLEAIRC